MRDVPDCLNRRNKVLNELLQEIRTVYPSHTSGKVPVLSYLKPGPEKSVSSQGPPPHPSRRTVSETMNNDVGTKLMCDFWKVLADDPDWAEEIHLRMCKDSCKAKCKNVVKRRDFSPGDCCVPSYSGKKNDSLRKALFDVRTAASFEQKCHEKVGELQIIQKDLIRQITSLEEKSKQETGLLKEADCMWSCMEGSYKNRLADAKENCELLQRQLNEIEASLNKWKRTHNEVETELKCVNQTCQDTNIKIIQKQNDIKIMQLEIQGFNDRIEANEKDLIAAKLSYPAKKEASDARVVKISLEMETFHKQYLEDCKHNEEKERQGQAAVKEVREDLQKLCKCLLQKKITNEDLRAETEALVNEVEMLKKACVTCKTRCNKREKNVMDQCKRIDKEISRFKLKCIRCHKETTSVDMTGFCFECPRCLAARECLKKDDHCEVDRTQECICTRIKKKFLDNVFDNMYTVLDRQVCTCPGKEIADCILNCLKRSRNGKLNQETRTIVQDFILSSVRQNLNLTIIGGAVKTRCEMDEDTYQQLMLCLTDVVVTQPEKILKTDKGVVVDRKLPCTRWTHSIECNCPSGPKTCPCLKSAERKSTSPSTCGPEYPNRPVEDVGRREDSSVRFCPLPGSVKLDGSLRDQPSAKSLKRSPCMGGTCNFSSKMRAAQCELGPEALANVRSHATKDGSTVRISTSNIQMIPSEHTYPADKRKFSGNLPVYKGKEPSDSTDKAVFFVTVPAFSTNKLTYSTKKPAYYANKPVCNPVEEKTYPADKFKLAMEETAYTVVEPAYLADEPACAVEERVHRPGGRAYPVDIYPVDKPVYPTEERVYRSDGRAYPADYPVYSADEPAYSAEERVYRANGRVYRRFEPMYPADEPAYPAEDRVYRHDGRAFSAYESIYPADDPAYPADKFVYRPDKRVYPPYDPMYLVDESAYPAEERVYRPDERAYPAYEPVYPGDEPAYLAEERAYMPDESKQKADRYPQKLDGRSLDTRMPESRAYTINERALKSAYPTEEHAYRPNGRIQKADGHAQKNDRRTLDESAPGSRENTTDERAQKVDRHPRKSNRHYQRSDRRAYPAEEQAYRPNGRTQRADWHPQKDGRLLDKSMSESRAYATDERAQKDDSHPSKLYGRLLDKSMSENRAYATDEREQKDNRHLQKSDRHSQKSDGRAYGAEEHAYRVNGRTQKADGHPQTTNRRTLDESAPESRENTTDERAQKFDRHPSKSSFEGCLSIFGTFGRLLDKSMSENRAYATDERAQKDDRHPSKLYGRLLDKSMSENRAYATDEREQKDERHLQKSDRHFQKSDGRAYPAEEHAYRVNGRTQKAVGHPQKTNRRTLDESAPESREDTTDERAQKIDRHPSKSSFEGCLSIFRTFGRLLDKSMSDNRAYATDEREQKDDRHLQKSDRHSQMSERRAYLAEEYAYRPNGHTQKADGHPLKNDRRSLDESVPESRENMTDERARKVDRYLQKPDGRVYPADEHV